METQSFLTLNSQSSLGPLIHQAGPLWKKQNKLRELTLLRDTEEKCYLVTVDLLPLEHQIILLGMLTLRGDMPLLFVQHHHLDARLPHHVSKSHPRNSDIHHHLADHFFQGRMRMN